MLKQSGHIRSLVHKLYQKIEQELGERRLMPNGFLALCDLRFFKKEFFLLHITYIYCNHNNLFHDTWSDQGIILTTMADIATVLAF